jgi:hypothetical protein
MAAHEPLGLRAPQNFKEVLQLENRMWREYRDNGREVGWSEYEIDAQYAAFTNDPLPAPGILRFFNNRNWIPNYVRIFSQAYRPDRLTDPDPEGGIEADAQKQYRDLVTWFGVPPRYVAQKSLGMGGRGMAALFQERGPGGRNEPGRDIVVKMPLEGWQDNVILEEKRMMKASHNIQRNDSTADMSKRNRRSKALHTVSRSSSLKTWGSLRMNQWFYPLNTTTRVWMKIRVEMKVQPPRKFEESVGFRGVRTSPHASEHVKRPDGRPGMQKLRRKSLHRKQTKIDGTTSSWNMCNTAILMI